LNGIDSTDCKPEYELEGEKCEIVTGSEKVTLLSKFLRREEFTIHLVFSHDLESKNF
jgi:hypothetical protein